MKKILSLALLLALCVGAALSEDLGQLRFVGNYPVTNPLGAWVRVAPQSAARSEFAYPGGTKLDLYDWDETYAVCDGDGDGEADGFVLWTDLGLDPETLTEAAPEILQFGAPVQPAPTGTGEMRVVNCEEWVSLREDPDTNSQRLAQVPLGATVTNCKRSGAYYRCAFGSLQGYVHSKYLTPAVTAGCHVADDCKGEYAGEAFGMQLVSYGSTGYLTDKYGAYTNHNFVDFDPATTWAESASGDGVGEQIWMEWAWEGYSPYATGVAIRNGYQKSGDTFRKNSRVRDVTVSLNGVAYEATLMDCSGWQYVVFDAPVRMEDYHADLCLTIRSVYSGSKYRDTCVSDLILMVNGE